MNKNINPIYYKIWCPSVLWVREELGFWKLVHYFMYLEDNQYISHNGAGPIEIFDSFEEMLRADTFPGGFVTRDSKITDDFKDARNIIEMWRIDYNGYRPHKSLKGLSPEQFVRNLMSENIKKIIA